MYNQTDSWGVPGGTGYVQTDRCLRWANVFVSAMKLMDTAHRDMGGRTRIAAVLRTAVAVYTTDHTSDRLVYSPAAASGPPALIDGILVRRARAACSFCRKQTSRCRGLSRKPSENPDPRVNPASVRDRQQSSGYNPLRPRACLAPNTSAQILLTHGDALVIHLVLPRDCHVRRHFCTPLRRQLCGSPDPQRAVIYY